MSQTPTKPNLAPEVIEAAPEIEKLDKDFDRLLQKPWTPAQGVFQDPDRFEHAQRVAKLLCASNLAPSHFQGQNNLGSAVIAVDMAFRLDMNPLMVMQQLYVVHGKPGWSAQFVIAVINASNRFSPLRFKFSGEGDKRQCIAYSKDLKSGEVLEGTPVSIDLAKKEGWYQKTGSKWQTMSEQMLAYRSASFWGRIYAPEMFMGLPTADEIEDMAPEVSPKPKLFHMPDLHKLGDTLKADAEKPKAEPEHDEPKPPKESKAERAARIEARNEKAKEYLDQNPEQKVVAEQMQQAAAVVADDPRVRLQDKVVNDLKVDEEFFLTWLHVNGTVPGANTVPGILDLSPEDCLKALALPEERLNKCKISGRK